jgi:hypothetical protein
MKPPPSRDCLLEQAFSDIPSTIGTYTLRPLSAGSFTLLGRLGNQMIVGKKKKTAAPADGEDEQSAMFAAVIQYVWIHSAALEKVCAVVTADDIPVSELTAIGFGLTLGEAFGFLYAYQKSALRMTASLTEVEPEESEDTGKPLESLPAGSLHSFTPVEEPEIPFASATYSGSLPSSEHSATFTPPTSPMEPAADGASLTLLPDLSATEPPN